MCLSNKRHLDDYFPDEIMCLSNKRHLDDYFPDPFVYAILSMCFNSKRKIYE